MNYIKPKVSIIMPNYNHAPYLKERLDSILHQTFQDFELILLDDASDDDSSHILKRYSNEPKVSHTILNAANSGSPFLQWRKGIELAKGEFIWIAESDDVADIHFLEKLIPYLSENKKVALVYADSEKINTDGKKLGLWSTKKNSFFKTERWRTDYIANGLNEVLDYLLYKTTINNASAVLLKKTALNDPDFLDELVKYKNVGDLFTYISMCLNADIAYCAQPLNYYRDHHQNITKINTRSGVLYQERLQCFGYSIRSLMRQNLTERQKQLLQKAVNFILRKNTFYLLDTGNRLTLVSFLSILSSEHIFSELKVTILQFLCKTYSLKNRILRKASKRMIKQLVQN